MLLFKERLKHLRQKHNMTQQQLADLLGVSKSTISGYENGACRPTIERLIRLGNIFNVPLDYFYINFESPRTEYVSSVRVPVLNRIPANIDLKSELSNPREDMPVSILYYRPISPEYQQNYSEYFIYEENRLHHTVHITSDVQIGDAVLACVNNHDAKVYFCIEQNRTIALADANGNIQSGNIAIIGVITESHSM